jgi:ABC-type bacteriocin/lantibiotic exporter with double-glycine peptidase domain
MKRWQDFLDSLSTNGGNIIALFMTTLLLLLPLALLSFYRPGAALLAVLTTTFSMFAGALVQSLRGNASRQQMMDRAASVAPNPGDVTATAAPAPEVTKS